LIVVALLSVSAVLLANEPLPSITHGCEFPSPCDLGTQGEGCSVGTCEAYGINCNTCCECEHDAVRGWGCYSNGDPDCL
jgi:hypothetical protein